MSVFNFFSRKMSYFDFLSRTMSVFDFVRLYRTSFDFFRFVEFVRLYPTLFDIVRLCLTLPSIVHFFFNFIGSKWKRPKLQRHSEIIWLFLSNHLSKTSAWATAKYNRKCHKNEHRTFCAAWLSCWTYVPIKQTLNGYFLTDLFKIGFFWPTRPNLVMFWPIWLKQK